VKQKNLVLMVVAVGCGLVAAILTSQMSGKPKVEEVKVLVAVKDLPTGTMITKETVDKMVKEQPVPKSSITHEVVINKEELVGKRLARGTRQGEMFNPADLKVGGIGVFLEGKNNYSIPMTAVKGAGGGVVPGSKVDVLASLTLSGKIGAFPLLVNTHVLEVNGEADLTKGNGKFLNMTMVTLAVSDEEASLLALAEKRGCELHLVLINPDRPAPANYDMKLVMQRLQDGLHPAFADSTQTEERKQPAEKDPAPAPVAAKPETIKVLVALENIAPNTEITKDLIEKKFEVKEVLSQYAPGACTDLNTHLGIGKVIKSEVAKGQWVTEQMIGLPGLKPAPRDEFALPKPAPEPDAKPEVRPSHPVVAAKVYQDVAVHTASGTRIYRYEVNVKTGDRKLVKILRPEQAAAAPAEPTEEKTETEKQPGTTDAKKVD
jgi:Flp pilus assembly protein CpaB